MVTRRSNKIDRENRLDRGNTVDRVERVERVVERDRYRRGYDGSGPIIYILGIIGAAFYFISQASTTLGVILGILKAIIWPAYAVYGLMVFFGL